MTTYVFRWANRNPRAGYRNTALDLVPKRINLLLLIMYAMFVALPFLKPLVSANPLLESFAGFAVINLFLVGFLGGTAKEILTRPFSVTLPNQKQYIRRHLLLVAILTNLLFVLPMLLFPATSTIEHLRAVVAVFCAGMSIFLGFLWTGIRFQSWTEASILGMLMGGAGILQFIWEFPPYAALVSAVITNPFLIFVLMLLLFTRYWTIFSDREHLRKLVGTPAMSMVESGDTKAMQEFYDDALNREPPRSSGTQQWFLDLTERLRPLHDQGWFCLRHRLLLLLRSSLRTFRPVMLLVMLSSLIPVTLLLLLIDLQVSYVFILFFVLWISAFGMSTQEIHSPQLPYNRRDIARSEVILSFFNSARTLLVCALALLLLNGLDMFFFDRDSQLPPFSCLSYLFVACPAIHALRMLVGNNPGWSFFIFMVIALVGQPQYYTTFPLFIGAHPLWWLALYLGGWGLLAPIAYWKYCTWDLVSNKH